MKGSTLIASAPSLDRACDLVAQYYGASKVSLDPISDDSPTAWTVTTGRGLLPSVIVRKVGSRYRFERLPEGFTVTTAKTEAKQ